MGAVVGEARGVEGGPVKRTSSMDSRFDVSHLSSTDRGEVGFSSVFGFMGSDWLFNGVDCRRGTAGLSSLAGSLGGRLRRGGPLDSLERVSAVGSSLGTDVFSSSVAFFLYGMSTIPSHFGHLTLRPARWSFTFSNRPHAHSIVKVIAHLPNRDEHRTDLLNGLVIKTESNLSEQTGADCAKSACIAR